MANLLSNSNAVRQPHGTYSFDDGLVDYYLARDPETGLMVQKPVAATDEEKRVAQAAALRRELAGIHHKLLHLEDPVGAWMATPSAADLERERTSLENTRKTIHAELKELGEKP